MVRVVIGAGGDLRFRAVRVLAHHGLCEPLHGSYFAVQAILRGELGETGRVIDFRSVGAALRLCCAELHDRILIPTRNPELIVSRQEEIWHVAHALRRWSFPACDVAALDVVNPTHEVLAGLCLAAARRALRDDPEAGIVGHIEVSIGDVEGVAICDEPWTNASSNYGMEA